MLKKKWWILIPLILIVAYLAGPKPSTPTLDASVIDVPAESVALTKYIAEKESRHKLRPDNEARIVWADDSVRSRTPYSILYLHGFSASQGEGDPIHRRIAEKFGCNLYLSRLAAHGIDTTEQLLTLTAADLWKSAKEAYAIASRIGDKVIVMGTSTGGSLALMLAATYPNVHSLVLLSPNIAIFDENAWVLNDPWGLQIARLVNGSDYVVSEDSRPIYKKYWNYGYRLEAVVQLEQMLETFMQPELFQKVKQPALMLYYYKDNVHQDSVVRVDKMLQMFDELATPPAKKRKIAVPGAGNHVLGSYIKSNDLKTVENEITRFMNEVLMIK